MWYLIKKTLFPPFRALDQERHKVLEIDSKGNLYLYRSALLCKNEIIKRLTEDNFKLVEPSLIGKVQSFTSYGETQGVLMGILGGGVAPGSTNPDPILDQKMSFSRPVLRPDLQNPYPFSDQAFRKKLRHHYLD